MTADLEYLKAPSKGPPDLEERDYNNLNEHLVVEFEDIFAEPEGIHTFNFAWNSSYNCYNFCHTFCYTFSTLCCGLCAVLQASSGIATAFFCHIWCGTPCMKAVHYLLILPKRLVNECVECLVTPCCQDLGDHVKSWVEPR